MGRYGYGNYRPANAVMEGIGAYGAVDDLYQRERDRETAKQDRERRIRREDASDARGALEFDWKKKDRARMEKNQAKQDKLSVEQSIQAIIQGAPEGDEAQQRKYYQGVLPGLPEEVRSALMERFGSASREEIAQAREVVGKGIANGAMLMSGQTADATDALNAINTFAGPQINAGGSRDGTTPTGKKVTGYTPIPNGKIALKVGVDAEDSTGLKQTYDSFLTTLRSGAPDDLIRQYNPEEIIDGLVNLDKSLTFTDVMLATYGDQAAMGRLMQEKKNQRIAGAIEDPQAKKLVALGVPLDQAQKWIDNGAKIVSDTLEDGKPVQRLIDKDGKTLKTWDANKLTAQEEAEAKAKGSSKGPTSSDRTLVYESVMSNWYNIAMDKYAGDSTKRGQIQSIMNNRDMSPTSKWTALLGILDGDEKKQAKMMMELAEKYQDNGYSPMAASNAAVDAFGGPKRVAKTGVHEGRPIIVYEDNSWRYADDGKSN